MTQTDLEKKYTQDQVNLFNLTAKVDTINEKLDAMKIDLSTKYVNKEELEIFQIKCTHFAEKITFLEKIVYSTIGLILTTVIGGIIVFYMDAPK